MVIIIIYKKKASDGLALAYREKNFYDSKV
jgi:hypothetical protein